MCNYIHQFLIGIIIYRIIPFHFRCHFVNAGDNFDDASEQTRDITRPYSTQDELNKSSSTPFTQIHCQNLNSALMIRGTKSVTYSANSFISLFENRAEGYCFSNMDNLLFISWARCDYTTGRYYRCSINSEAGSGRHVGTKPDNFGENVPIYIHW